MIKNIFTKLDTHMQEVVRGTILAFVLKIIGAGLNFGLSVAIARLFGAEGAGIYFLAFSIMAIGSVIARVGLDNALLKFIASSASHQEWGKVKGVYSLGMKMAIIVSIIVSAVLFTTAQWTAAVVFNKPELVEPLRWMSLSILPFAILNLHAESFKGLNSIKEAMLLQSVGVPLIALLLIYPLSQYAGVTGAVWGYLIATTIVAILAVWAWRMTTCKYIIQKELFPFEKLWSACSPLFWISVMQRAVLPWAPLFFLGVWTTNEEVGMFGSALRVAMLVSLFSLTINNVIAPKYAALFSKGDMVSLATTAQRSGMLLTLLSSPIFIVLIFASSWVMGIFGKEFERAGELLAIISIGHFTGILSGSAGYLLMMTGNEKTYRNLTIYSVIAQVVLSVILIPYYGSVGAAVSVASALIFLNFSSMWAVRYRLGFYSSFILNIFQRSRYEKYL